MSRTHSPRVRGSNPCAAIVYQGVMKFFGLSGNAFKTQFRLAISFYV